MRFIFGTKELGHCRNFNFLIPVSLQPNVVTLDILNYRILLDCKDKGIRQFEFVAQTQFFCKEMVENRTVVGLVIDKRRSVLRNAI